MIRAITLNYKQDCTAVNKEDILPRIKREMLSKAITETNANKFWGLFEIIPYTDAEAWIYVDYCLSNNGTYYHYGIQYEPQELFKLVKERCFIVRLFFKFEVEI